MKKLACIALLLPTFMFAQEAKKDVNSHEVTKGFYGSITVNQISQLDETVNGKITAGMHFSNFHIGAHYITSFGDNATKIDRISANKDTEIKYSGFGLDLMYEVDVHEKMSVAPFLNTSLMKYEITKFPHDPLADILFSAGSLEDNYLNTQIGTKLFFTPNRNFKIGLDIGYNIANGVSLYNTENEDLSGMSLGLTIQFNHFYPKW